MIEAYHHEQCGGGALDEVVAPFAGRVSTEPVAELIHLSSTQATVTSPEAPEASEYPDIHFEFDDSKMRGTGVLPANETTRYRGIVKALTGGWEGYRNRTVSDAQLASKKLINNIGNTVKIGGEEKKKTDILPLNAAIDMLLRDLFERHHPTAQAFAQLEAEYSDIGHGIILGLERAIVCGFHDQEILDLYKQVLAAARQK